MKTYTDSEKAIQQQIIHYLGMKGYYVMRLNSGRIRTEGGGLVKLMEAGTPDVMAFRKKDDVCSEPCNHAWNSDLLFVEVKRKGNKPTYLQEMKMKELEEYGARCIIAHSVEELQEAGI